MNERITSHSIFHRWQTGLLFASFFGIRILSFLLAPHPFIQGVIVFALVLLFGTLYFTDPMLAWQALLIELFLGGSGHYLELATLSLRTVLIATFLALWMLHALSNTAVHQYLRLDKRISIPLALFGLYLIFSFFNAIYNQHDVVAALQDLTPFAFFLLLFPFQQLFHKEESRTFFVRLAVVYLFGTAFFLLALFLLYSNGLLEIHEPFYKWFRDVNAGKITDMGNGFYRIVEPSHLLVVPVILFISSLLMKQEKHNKMWCILLVAALLILAINLSRIYILALGVGWLVLLYKHHIHRWFTRGLITLGIFLGLFISLSLIGSGGRTLGLELLGVRIASVAAPIIETSSATRLDLLEPIIKDIEKTPLLGTGPGATVTYLDSRTYETITTRQFDWGYLEMLAEFGAIGTILFLTLFFHVIAILIKYIKSLRNYHDPHVGFLAGIISLMVINITSPALFHVFGILFLIFLITIALQHNSLFDEMITTLYRVFNRLKQKNTAL